jgi:hypothetical protein
MFDDILGEKKGEDIEEGDSFEDDVEEFYKMMEHLRKFYESQKRI